MISAPTVEREASARGKGSGMDVSDARTAQMIATVAQEWRLCPLRIKQRA